MDNKTLEILIDKYLTGTCTPSEEQRLMDWYDTPKAESPYTASLSTERRLALQKDLLHQIKHQTARSGTKEARIKRLPKRIWLYAVAAVLLFIVALPILNPHNQRQTTFQTAYGEIRSVMLPDDSEVTLNGNSTISYHKATNREIWLDGEAAFKVTKKLDKQRFIVHLADTLSIEVVGTEFNVQKRTSGIQIALKTGKIRLHYARKGKPAEIVEMEPNDVVYIGNSTSGEITKKVSQKAVAHFAWQDRKILLDNTSFAEIQLLLAETYDIRTAVLQESILKRKASGSIPVIDNHRQLLDHIITLYGLAIVEAEEERQYVLTTR
ncbi:FecR domain-containing protein [Parapedobacter sp. ISTM3]|uniref:FecR family protein n=1 Tax=Parapedobacter sp. ISTM3 TaxID=2800130 RepID=UPI001904A647|nr:FecR domain-containing protein [Parapedobacter sp. ISTM3]MBK1441709.1 FecR domain-containing protein [Parapedobacter sp. ISTM3]